jgi:hypothetical protein
MSVRAVDRKTPETPYEAVVELAGLATELMQYASYAEIVKMLGVNQTQIRDISDRIIAVNQELERMLDTAEVPMFDVEGRLYDRVERFELTRRRSGEADFEKAAHDCAVELKAAREENERFREAADRIAPYLIYTVGDESPGHHPTMPSAVGAFLHVFGIGTAEKRLERARARFHRNQSA